MDFDSFKPEFQYFYIYPHHFWLAACYTLHFQAGQSCHSCVCHCVITNDGRHFIITYNGLIQAGNKTFCIFCCLWFEFYSASGR